MYSLLLAVVLLLPGPLTDAVDLASGPLTRATWPQSSADVDTFVITTQTGNTMTVELEQPPRPKTTRDIDLSRGPTLGPDVGCRSSSCGMCVLNSLASHGQSYEYLSALTHTERMRLHHRLHNEPDCEGVKGKTQRVGESGRVRIRRLFGRRR